ncbi:hypothetical protein BXZ70DRAFT_500350 [Cristinia sonorae]|uniref:Uncharacterized protein n=1 Tax=Cristinia sonorae TaxID=1940300 RepID=A0A8K0UGC5_9AGAR|nr:hypothetical protein BXZ70DRAFT_500350 [Cristinia sonorae]
MTSHSLIDLFTDTLLSVVSQRPYLKPVTEKSLETELFGNLFLTELGHGLVVERAETAATKVDGGFYPEYTMFIPPTLPLDGISRWGIVMCQVVADGEAHGINPFLIQTSDKGGILPGINITCLPSRGGSILDYSLTPFNNVLSWRPRSATQVLRSPRTAGHSSSSTFNVFPSACYTFWQNTNMYRCGLLRSTYRWRASRSQSHPVADAVALSHVFEVWMQRAMDLYTNEKTADHTRTVLWTIFKAMANKLILQDVGGGKSINAGQIRSDTLFKLAEARRDSLDFLIQSKRGFPRNQIYVI